MSCVLKIAGKNLDVDAFIYKSKLKGFIKKYKSEDLKSKNQGKQYSYVSATISEAGLENFQKQISDAIEYLNKNKRKLELIKTTYEVEYATINFMVNLKSVSDKYFAQYIYIPKELTIICGNLSLGIEVAIV